ncbi:hypothetical protein Tsubulata_015871 [Turnera subulata]|uniref:NB-ARC domain-containing protein n=1 Tax=Turnera subulata TaxID=218843 RepID=A0A9Q0GL66_9ROSI|nr:hypothetical protein Tsubulata_015871 [Turnera subulata]
MHDLIRQMCEAIVLDENRRKRSRLWRHNDILQVLNKPKGAERVEALSLDMSQVSRIIQLSPEVFEEMDNLRLLRIYSMDASWYLELPQGLEYLPSTLRLLHWDLYPSPSLPSNFRPDSIVYLKMHESRLTQLWQGENVRLVNLKVCDLTESKELVKIMDFSGVPNLEELRLWGCRSLVEIPPSIQLCRKLIKVIVWGCVKLRGFPSDLPLTSLEEVNLYNSPRITELPKLPSTLRNLSFQKSGIKLQVTAAASIGHLIRLKGLFVGEISEGMLSQIGCLNCLEGLFFRGGPASNKYSREDDLQSQQTCNFVLLLLRES